VPSTDAGGGVAPPVAGAAVAENERIATYTNTYIEAVADDAHRRGE
jgi:hypothetical protein